MVRLVGLSALGLAVVLFSGCGSDRREQPIQAVVNALNLSVENIKSINTHLKAAEELKKKVDEAGSDESKKEAKKAYDSKIGEVENSIKDLKKQAEKLLDEMRRAEKNPLVTTPEEKQELARKYQARVKEALENLSKERGELSKTWERMDKALDEKSFKDLNRMFRSAEGEFENLSRLRT